MLAAAPTGPTVPLMFYQPFGLIHQVLCADASEASEHGDFFFKRQQLLQAAVSTELNSIS